MNKTARIIELRSNDPLLALLQDQLRDVLDQDRFDNLSLAAVVGVIEFLKWNLINRA
jgi:hypothetical protein